MLSGIAKIPNAHVPIRRSIAPGGLTRPAARRGSTRSTSSQIGMPDSCGRPIVPMMRKPLPSSTRPERVPHAVFLAVATAQYVCQMSTVAYRNTNAMPAHQ